tara:strand:- start:683 stop:1306 length:624 start_codon:yes stop_codon:yes gene_type:complete
MVNNTIKLKNHSGLIIVLAGALAYTLYLNHNLKEDLEDYKGYYKSIAVKYIQEIMEKPEMTAPEMEVTSVDFDSNMLLFQDLDGTKFSLRDFQNKILFINYWATWCNPCLAEMPSMAELYNEYKDNNEIVFLYLSKEKAQTIIDYIPKDESLKDLPIYKIITDDDLFATSGIPTTFIVNRKGEILVKDVGSALWNDPSVVNYINNLL